MAYLYDIFICPAMDTYVIVARFNICDCGVFYCYVIVVCFTFL